MALCVLKVNAITTSDILFPVQTYILIIHQKVVFVLIYPGTHPWSIVCELAKYLGPTNALS